MENVSTHLDILRSDDNTPAYVSLVFAVTMNSKLKGHVGSPSKSLLKLLMDDLEDRNLFMDTLKELNEIKDKYSLLQAMLGEFVVAYFAQFTM